MGVRGVEAAAVRFTFAIGRGTPVVTVHGGMGLDHTYFRPWLDGLAAHCELSYVDLRGCGRSPALSDGESYLDAWTADIDGVRTAHGHERVTVLGHSLAAWVALEYARRYPEQTAGLILCNGTPRLDYGEAMMTALLARATPQQAADLQALFGSPSFDDATYRALYLGILPLYFHHEHPEFAAHVAATARFSAAAFLGFRDTALATFDSLPWLSTITAPTLAITGRHDLFTPAEHGAARFAALMPNAAQLVLEHSGHFPFVEEPEAFAAAVGAWLARET
jgi:proline iminopeptidase